MNDILSNFQQHEIAGIIAQLIAIPFLIMFIQKWWLANQSKQWLQTTGVIIKGFDISVSRLPFLYEFEISGIKYQGKKPFIATSYKNLNVKRTWELTEKYAKGNKVAVFYNPYNPKQSVLEPGRKEGVIAALTVMIILFVFGFISQHQPLLIGELVSYFQN